LKDFHTIFKRQLSLFKRRQIRVFYQSIGNSGVPGDPVDQLVVGPSCAAFYFLKQTVRYAEAVGKIHDRQLVGVPDRADIPARSFIIVFHGQSPLTI
jgi:hypothetical protein